MRRQVLVLAACVVTACSNVKAATSAAAVTNAPNPRPGLKEGTHEIYGKLRSIEGSQLTLETREGKVVHVDAGSAMKAHHSPPLTLGHAFSVRGMYDSEKVLHAEMIQRAKESPAMWPADR